MHRPSSSAATSSRCSACRLPAAASSRPPTTSVAAAPVRRSSATRSGNASTAATPPSSGGRSGWRTVRSTSWASRPQASTASRWVACSTWRSRSARPRLSAATPACSMTTSSGGSPRWDAFGQAGRSNGRPLTCRRSPRPCSERRRRSAWIRNRSRRTGSSGWKPSRVAAVSPRCARGTRHRSGCSLGCPRWSCSWRAPISRTCCWRGRAPARVRWPCAWQPARRAAASSASCCPKACCWPPSARCWGPSWRE